MKTKTRRTVSKLFALLLAMVMILAMGTTAFADNNTGGESSETTTTTYTLAIKGTTAGHTYDVYQIFAGELSTNESGTKILSSIDWGSGVNSETLLSALKADPTIGRKFTNCETAADVAEALEDFTAAQMDAFAAIVKTGLTTATKSDVASSADSTVIEGLDAGYYIVVETTKSSDMPSGETYTEYIIQVVGDTEIEVKSGTVTSDKQVIDTNDSLEANDKNQDDETFEEPGVSQDTADHDIGDTISYRLTGTLPENYADYNGYYYKFTDTLSKGLTLDPDSIEVKVEIGGTEYTLGNNDYTVVVGEADTDGNVTFTVGIGNLKELTTDADGTYQDF